MEFARVPSSFRDPAGFIVSAGGLYKRVVTARGREHYDHFTGCGLYRELSGHELLIPHIEDTPAAIDSPEIYKVLIPRQIDYITYPYEWCFSQLKDAALLTLDIQARAIRRGMSLKDASAFNVQFQNGRPVFIDTLSFEHDDGGPWVAYEQFCKHFLAPLLLMGACGPRFNQYLRVDLDGFPLDFASRLLPWSSYFRTGPLLHIHLHRRARSSKAPAAERSRPKGGSLKEHLVDHLRRTVEKLRVPYRPTAWSGYAASADHYSSEAGECKKTFVETVVRRHRPQLVYDCGGNTGTYARAAAAIGSRCVLFDADAACIEQAYQMEKESRSGNLLPLVMDFCNPTPPLGFHATERLGLLQRPRADLVLALALIHHLRIRENIPFENLAGFFRSLGSRLVVEFVMPDDPMATAMRRSRPVPPEDYCFDRFLQAFEQEFRLVEKIAIPGTQRLLLHFEAIA